MGTEWAKNERELWDFCDRAQPVFRGWLNGVKGIKPPTDRKLRLLYCAIHRNSTEMMLDRSSNELHRHVVAVAESVADGERELPTPDDPSEGYMQVFEDIECAALDIEGSGLDADAIPECVEALKQARGFGNQGENDEGISVSYVIDEALKKANRR